MSARIFYDYYICGGNTLVKDQEVKQKPFLFFSNYHIINVDIRKCFDKIDHQTALKKYPLCNKYHFFLKAWLKISSNKGGVNQNHHHLHHASANIVLLVTMIIQATCLALTKE
jgi:hypothetical protein